MLKVGNKQETSKLNHSLCLAGKVNQVKGKDIYIIFQYFMLLRLNVKEYCQKFSLFALRFVKKIRNVQKEIKNHPSNK